MAHARLLGAHLSIAGGIHTVFMRAAHVGARCVQIFTKNNKAYFAKKLTDTDIVLFKEAWDASDVGLVVAHAAYIINIGASNEDVEKKSRVSLRDEIFRCDQLGIKYLVLHPGSHTGAGRELGIAKIARNLSDVLSDGGSCMVLLETAAGQGTNVGSTFEELRAIYDQCDAVVKDRIGVCLDTCHVFAAGHDITTTNGYKELWRRFDTIVGRSLLRVIHLNDSKTVCGSRKDRHENIGKGTIGIATLSRFVDDPSLAQIPIILETPSSDGISEYKEEIELLS